MFPIGNNIPALAALLIAAAAPAAAQKPVLDAARLAACFAHADARMLAGLARQSPGEAAAALDAAAQAEIERDRPGSLNRYVGERLAACLGAHLPPEALAVAHECYEQTLWARAFFASRRHGVTLDRMREGYRRTPELLGAPAGLLEAAYASTGPEDDFRRDWFVACAR